MRGMKEFYKANGLIATIITVGLLVLMGWAIYTWIFHPERLRSREQEGSYQGRKN